MELVIGLTGAALILAAFILNETHIWNEDWLAYDLTNLVGAGLMIWYSWTLRSLPFGVLNGVWAAVALRDVVIDLRRKMKPRVIQ